MVEKRIDESNVSQDLLKDPSVNLLTINKGMEQQKLNEIKDKIESQKNEEPVEVFVKDRDEAAAVTKAEYELMHDVPDNASEVLGKANVDKLFSSSSSSPSSSSEESTNVTEQVKEQVKKTGETVVEKAKKLGEDTSENIKGATEKLSETTKDLTSKATEKLGELKETASEKWQETSKNLHEFTEKATEKAGEYKEAIKQDISRGIDVAKHQAQELGQHAQEKYRHLKRQDWTQSPYLYFFMGVFVAGASFVLYNTFFGHSKK